MRRHTYRRTLAAATALITASLALGACAGASGGGDDNTLTVWHNATTGDGSAYWQQMAEDFMAAHEGVTVEVQAIQNEELDGKLQTAQNAGEGPDVFLARGGGKLSDMVEAGLVLDISDKIDDAVAGAVPEGAVAAYTVGEGVYAMPTSFQPGGIFYSQDLFDARRSRRPSSSTAPVACASSGRSSCRWPPPESSPPGS